ncbi:MAG: hypothetical protein MRY32_04605 [Rickettsiales bacterium]|nr:hypothetical protein [Rickettsiales bacterium]
MTDKTKTTKGGHRYSNIVEEQIQNRKHLDMQGAIKQKLDAQQTVHKENIRSDAALAEFSRAVYIKRRFDELVTEIGGGYEGNGGYKSAYEAALVAHGGDKDALQAEIDKWRETNEGKPQHERDTKSPIAKAALYKDFFVDGKPPRAEKGHADLEQRLKDTRAELVSSIQSRGKVVDEKTGKREPVTAEEAEAIVVQMEAAMSGKGSMLETFQAAAQVDLAKKHLEDFNESIMKGRTLALEEERIQNLRHMMELYAGKTKGMWGDQLFNPLVRELKASELRGTGVHFIRAAVKHGDISQGDLDRILGAADSPFKNIKLTTDEMGAIMGVVGKHMALGHGHITLINGAVQGMTKGAAELFNGMFKAGEKISIESWDKFKKSVSDAGHTLWEEGKDGASMVKYHVQLNEISHRAGLLQQVFLNPEQNPFGSQYLTEEDRLYLQDDMGGLYGRILQNQLKLSDAQVAKLKEAKLSGDQSVWDRLLAGKGGQLNEQELALLATDEFKVTTSDGKVKSVKDNQALYRPLTYNEIAQVISPVLQEKRKLLNTFTGVVPDGTKEGEKVYLAHLHYQGWWGGHLALFGNHGIDIPKHMMQYADTSKGFEASLAYRREHMGGATVDRATTGRTDRADAGDVTPTGHRTELARADTLEVGRGMVGSVEMKDAGTTGSVDAQTALKILLEQRARAANV